MSNFEVQIPHVDGSLHIIYEMGVSGKDVIHSLYTDDFGPPPKSMDFIVKTISGKTVKLRIPYDSVQPATVFIDGEII